LSLVKKKPFVIDGVEIDINTRYENGALCFS